MAADEVPAIGRPGSATAGRELEWSGRAQVVVGTLLSCYLAALFDPTLLLHFHITRPRLDLVPLETMRDSPRCGGWPMVLNLGSNLAVLAPLATGIVRRARAAGKVRKQIRRGSWVRLASSSSGRSPGRRLILTGRSGRADGFGGVLTGGLDPVRERPAR